MEINELKRLIDLHGTEIPDDVMNLLGYNSVPRKIKLAVVTLFCEKEALQVKLDEAEQSMVEAKGWINKSLRNL